MEILFNNEFETIKYNELAGNIANSNVSNINAEIDIIDAIETSQFNQYNLMNIAEAYVENISA